jgi:hypothetical protein
MTPDEMWQLMLEGSEELADELGLEAPPPVFTPARALPAIDTWLSAHDEPLDDDETAQLGMLLARVLIETHGGGLVQIREKRHALDGEWAASGFERDLPRDFHVPFVVSAVRIGMDRSLGAEAWYRELMQEASG